MDCRRAAEIISGARDGQQLPAAEVVQAQRHCAECAECAALLATMRRMDDIPPAHAPAALVERILAAAQAEADARLDAEAAREHVAPASGVITPTSGVITPLSAAKPRAKRSGPAWWQPRFTAYATAAVVVLVVSAASTYTLMQMTRSMDATSTEDSLETMSAESFAADEGASDADASASLTEGASDAKAAGAVAPAYVAWGGFAWVRADGPTPTASELTTAGTTTSDLGDPSGPADRTVLTLAADPEAIFVQSADGTLMRFTRVVRTLGMREYALSAGGSLATFGTWPSLPPTYATPTADDGSPTFTRQGFDDRSLDIYVPVGGDAANGFALAPGTPPEDPAAGNPFWTWWEPVE